MHGRATIPEMSDESMLARVNAIPITKEEMWDLPSSCEEWDREHPGDHEVGFGIVASCVKKGEHFYAANGKP